MIFQILSKYFCKYLDKFKEKRYFKDSDYDFYSLNIIFGSNNER